MHQEFDPRDLEPALPQDEARRRKLKLAPTLLVLAAIAGFATIVWYVYDAGQREAKLAAMPVIKADGGPTKVKPDDPGGMNVPNQDALVLNDSPANRGTGGVERLLPPPETPLPRPAPPQGASSLPPAIGPTPTRQSSPSASAALPPATSLSDAPAPSAAPRAPVDTRAASSSGSAASSSTPVPPPPSATQTASVPAVAAPAKPPVTVVKPAAGQGGYRIQLAAVKSEQAASSEWARIEKANPELAQLTMMPTRVDLGDKGIFYRIQAGPLADAAAADHLCAQLKQRNQGCIIVKP
jgi:cell division septation protein DedD